MPLEFLVAAFVTLFVVVDPIGLTPTFLAVTERLPLHARRTVALRASLIAGAILIAVCGISLFANVIMGTQEGPLVGGSTSAGVLPGLIAGLVLLIVGDDN